MPINMENQSKLYAEKYGIISYSIKSNVMLYYANYPTTRETYKVKVDLVVNKETSREKMSKYYKKGNDNMYK